MTAMDLIAAFDLHGIRRQFVAGHSIPGSVRTRVLE
jgi:hypothetical protein